MLSVMIMILAIGMLLGAVMQPLGWSGVILLVIGFLLGMLVLSGALAVKTVCLKKKDQGGTDNGGRE